MHHPNNIKCSVLTTDNNTDIKDANTTAPDCDIDDCDIDEFVSIEPPNNNTSDSDTIYHINQNDCAPVRHTSENVQVVLPKQNQTVKYRDR